MNVFAGKLEQIGVIRSPYHERKDAPSQGRHARDKSTLDVFEDYESALHDIEQCSHLIVLYWQAEAPVRLAPPGGQRFTACLQLVHLTAPIR
jgi:tRNA (Thr-GGU) A37 N-methylase